MSMLFQRAAVEPADADSRSVNIVASTEALDSHGTVLRSNWDLARYLTNPVVLWAHNSRELPIGVAKNVRVEDGVLRATVDFVAADMNPKAEEVLKAIRAKVVRGVSVGFMSHSHRWEKLNDAEVLVLDDNELLEISVCTIPSNPEALAEVRTRAIRTKTEETPMNKEALALLGAENETQALARIQSLVSIAALTGQTGESARGVVMAWKDSHDRLADAEAELTEARAALAASKALLEKRDVEALLDSEDASKKLTKAERDEYRRQIEEKLTSVEAVRSMLAVRAILPSARVAPTPPSPTDPAQLKKYEDLTPAEKHRLANDSPELFNDLRADWEGRGRPTNQQG